MAADIILTVWTCSGTAGQFTVIGSPINSSTPYCSPASAGAWTTYTIKQNDPVPIMDIVSVLILLGCFVCFFAGFSHGRQR